MTPILDMIDVCKIYRMGSVDVTALMNVNLTINEGDFVSIMGPSGCGKSTLMNIIGCLDRPTNGKIKIEDTDVSILPDMELARIRGKKIGFVFQTFNLISRLTALRNVELPMIYQDISRSERLKRSTMLLEMFGLGDRANHKPAELSGGQRQRVAIARALANEPKILLADEPTGNLDSKTGQEIMKIFKELNNEGKTIIMVTHDQGMAQNCDQIIKLKDGKLENGK